MEELNFDVMEDPDYPPEAVNSNIIVEEIEMNGRIQKIYKKTYYLIDGKTINITRMEQAWFDLKKSFYWYLLLWETK